MVLGNPCLIEGDSNRRWAEYGALSIRRKPASAKPAAQAASEDLILQAAPPPATTAASAGAVETSQSDSAAASVARKSAAPCWAFFSSAKAENNGSKLRQPFSIVHPAGNGSISP